MSYWLGVVFFVVALLTSVMVHEAGHFLTARAFGMKATQFFVGFGPTLFSRRHGETEYGVKAIPAGGFVKIIGMTPFEEVEPADEPRSFHRKRLSQRVIVLAAGSATHFVIAVLLILGVAFFAPRPVAGTRVDAVSDCVAVQSAPSGSTPPPLVDGSCPVGSIPSPAKGRLQVGDVLAALDGVPFGRDTDVAHLLRTTPSAQHTLTVRRAGVDLQVPVTLAAVQRSQADGGPGFVLGFTRGPVAFSQPSWDEAWSQTRTLLGTSDQGLLGSIPAAVAKIPQRYTQLFGANAGNLDGPQSVVGIAQLSGGIAGEGGVPVAVRIAQLVLIVASVNFFVGVLNLLPLLPFDGGHIAVNVVDRLRNRLRRRRQLSVGSISDVYARFAPVSYAVFAVIAVGSVLVLASNVAHPLRL